MSVGGPDMNPYSANPYSEILAETQRHHRLLTVHWELTYRCNEKCTHCYLDVFAPRANVPGELTTQECLNIIDQISSAGALNLTLSGGEILVRHDFFEIAEYARSKRLLLRLFTNGILVKPGVADHIAALHPYAVEISLYSTRPEVHDRITQLKHSWELTVRALRLLHERGVRTVMKTPLMRENVDEVDELESLANSLGAGFKYDITITPKDAGGLSPLEHRLAYQQLVELFRVHIDPSQWIGRQVSGDARTCGITLNSLSIDPYGDVFPCLQIRSKAGNLRDKSLREIWESSPVWQQLGALTLNELPVCRTCELRSLCVRCHGLALAEDRDLKGPAKVNCREAMARRQALIDRGDLPADFPIPSHLQDLVHEMKDDLLDAQVPGPANFIPSSALMANRHKLFVQI